ncbi:LacI family DNA-binding transcriptional regulator [Actinophytocola gossypii]|uniref:LacI family DNA-binding transcriptional regulator n=1 Tax=Actinophytocola gossypii TaxID=2812003 RepID=A0ABT2J5P3_9PSEU|nr:LacI family DNA-binding transcriptional regulator [Actinophytocola gossypii]MCT2583183.1 LacI family DNA-binding transcriptional regulator [Actinophytocola gossypii]
MAGRERRPVTIYEVADRAGVSIATVSRALRDSELVAPPTRRRVQRVAEELRFRPSRAGRALAEGQHAANGIVFPDLSGPYYAEVVLGYEEVVAELGRSVLILATQGRDNAAELVAELAGRVDGMVIMGRTVDDATVARIADTGLPLVLLARPRVGLVDTVTADNTDSARALTGHLLGHGHRELAFLGDPARSPDVAGRFAGFSAALADAGLDPVEPVRSEFDVRSGYTAARELLSRGRTRPEAVVCANDEVALGALRAAEDLGLSVPGDLALTGWDDIMASHYARLTTVHQAMRELGATAARWLDERISGVAAGARHEVLPTRLVIRASCGSHHDRPDE